MFQPSSNQLHQAKFKCVCSHSNVLRTDHSNGGGLKGEIIGACVLAVTCSTSGASPYKEIKIIVHKNPPSRQVHIKDKKEIKMR